MIMMLIFQKLFKKFTFQYGSTQMRICLRNQYSQIHNLHSNMDLLK